MTAPTSPSSGGAAREGARELAEGAVRWRVSHLLGVGEMRRRYARSKLGQFWVTLSTGVTIAALGFVWSGLWKVETATLIPYISVSLVLWGFISGVISEAPTAFTQAAPILHNQGMNFSTVVYGMMWRNILVLAHNAPIVVLAMLIYRIAPAPTLPLAFVGLALLIVFMTAFAYLVAIVCLRFRDVTQIVQNSVTVLFFVTPVLWRPEQIAADKAFLLSWNPFAVLMSAVWKPILGQSVPAQDWLIAFAYALGASLLALPLIGATRRRLIYWL